VLGIVPIGLFRHAAKVTVGYVKAMNSAVTLAQHEAIKHPHTLDKIPMGSTASMMSIQEYYRYRLPSTKADCRTSLPDLLPLPYVYTAPEKDCLVKADDLLIIAVSEHNPVHIAACIAQRVFRKLYYRQKAERQNTFTSKSGRSNDGDIAKGNSGQNASNGVLARDADKTLNAISSALTGVGKNLNIKSNSPTLNGTDASASDAESGHAVTEEAASKGSEKAQTGPDFSANECNSCSN
jgi:hypothetical protein